jgi:hypothetical protein
MNCRRNSNRSNWLPVLVSSAGVSNPLSGTYVRSLLPVIQVEIVYAIGFLGLGLFTHVIGQFLLLTTALKIRLLDGNSASSSLKE